MKKADDILNFTNYVKDKGLNYGESLNQIHYKQ